MTAGLLPRVYDWQDVSFQATAQGHKSLGDSRHGTRLPW